jgi:hypothetical protein
LFPEDAKCVDLSTIPTFLFAFSNLDNTLPPPRTTADAMLLQNGSPQIDPINSTPETTACDMSCTTPPWRLTRNRARIQGDNSNIDAASLEGMGDLML